MKTYLSIVLLLLSCSAMSQRATASAQQVVTLRLMDISILEKQPVTPTIESSHSENALIKVYSSEKWITIIKDEVEIETEVMIKNTTELDENSKTTIVKTAKIVTLSKI